MNFQKEFKRKRYFIFFSPREARSRSDYIEKGTDQLLVNDMLDAYHDLETLDFTPGIPLQVAVDRKVYEFPCFQKTMQPLLHNTLYCNQQRLGNFEQEPTQLKESKTADTLFT